MPPTIIALSQAYVVAALVDAFNNLNIFSELQTEVPVSLDTLASRTNARRAYLRIGFELLHSFGWVEKIYDAGDAEAYCLSRMAQPGNCKAGIGRIYQLEPQALLSKREDQAFLVQCVDRLADEMSTLPTVDLQAGPVLVPLLSLLHRASRIPEVTADPMAMLPAAIREALGKYFKMQGWADAGDAVGSMGVCLTQAGRDLIEQSGGLDLVLACRPLLARLGSLLKGDNTPLDASLIRRMRALERDLLREGSDATYPHFAEIEQQVTALFDTDDYANQPHYIAELGCGDGTLLLRLQDAIRHRTLRGKVLDSWPLTLVGIDNDPDALDAAAGVLAAVPHKLIHGDINDPQLVSQALLAQRIDPGQVLHVRAFLDHRISIDHFIDRDLHTPTEVAASFPLLPGAGYVDSAGAELEPRDVVRHWRAHLERWAWALSRHGMIVAQIHCVRPRLTPNGLARCASLHLDFLQALAGHYLIDAELFAMLAAKSGLFADGPPRRYPDSGPFCHATLQHLRRREYRIRFAQQADLCALYKLEERCWPQPLRTPVRELRRRIIEFPQGQLVVEWHNRAVGVIYSQRINALDDVAGLCSDNVAQAHRPNGRLVQLLALNVLPAMQSHQLGDALLEFMLQRCHVMDDVKAWLPYRGVMRSSTEKGRMGWLSWKPILPNAMILGMFSTRCCAFISAMAPKSDPWR